MSLLKVTSIETLYFDRIYALRGISLQFEEKMVFAVLGPNGAGKSTLLKTIAGLLKGQPRKGLIEFMDRRISGLSPERISSLGIVYVPEDRGLFRELKVKENIELGCWGRRDGEIKEDLERVYSLFPILRNRREQQAETLSGGEQQMLAISRALLRRPRLLMLDEPSLGLAPVAARFVYGALHQVCNRNTAILLVEQNARMALGIAHYGYIMETGRIVLEGSSQELKENANVQELYLGLGKEKGTDQEWRFYSKKRRW